MRGYFAVGVYHPKKEVNVGSLWRTANILGAAFMFTVGRRYRPDNIDTTKSWRHVPLFHFDDLASLWAAAPYSCPVVGVELHESATAIERFAHPERAIYLLGAEDHGLPPDVIKQCHHLVKLQGEVSMNVAIAGSIVLYDRLAKKVCA